ncbi:hypothetical protein DSO57_1025135 [Entomophthora muscae]|nr:hypothetical protein DSO57_1025135 [Entomophthora muscae]
MEHYPMNFVQLVNSGKAPALRLNHHFRQLIAAVHYLHENGIVHRDLKLENLCLSRSNNLKLVDFGNAMLFEPPRAALCSDVVGTDRYIAPELLLGGTYDAIRSDMWSLGILYLAMLLRKLPWPLPHRDQPTYQEFLRSPTKFISQFHPWGLDFIPREIVVKMLDPCPETRLTIAQLMDTPWFNEMMTLSS